SESPYNRVRDRCVHQRDIPALDLILRLAPLPSEFTDAAPVQAESRHAGQGRAVHQSKHIQSPAVAKTSRAHHTKVEERAEEKDEEDVLRDLRAGTSRLGHDRLLSETDVTLQAVPIQGGNLQAGGSTGRGRR